jgi:hypothetical protein
MSFQLQPPSLLPFTLGPPSFHPWLHLCFEPNRNVSLSEWGGGFCSHRHSTIQLMTMELELDSHVVPWPPLTRVQLIDLNSIGLRTIGRCGGNICAQYIDRLVPWPPRMVFQLTQALSATFAFTICTIVKSIWFCAIIGFLVVDVCTSNMCAFICSN